MRRLLCVVYGGVNGFGKPFDRATLSATQLKFKSFDLRPRKMIPHCFIL